MTIDVLFKSFFFEGNIISQTFQISFYAVVLFQAVFISIQWYIIRRPDYLYYLAYMISLVPYYLSHSEQALGFPVFFSYHPDLRIYFDKPMLVILFLTYTHFARQFIDVHLLAPKLDNFVKRLVAIFVAIGVFVCSFMFLTGKMVVTEILLLIFFSVLFVNIAWVLYKLIRAASTQLNYFMIAGTICIITGSVLSTILFATNDLQFHQKHMLPSFPSQFFILMELLIFTTGLSHKTTLLERQKKEAEQKLNEELLAKQQLRQQIADNLHDDMGATLSSISIYASVAKRMLTDGNSEQIRHYLQRIYQDSNDMMTGLRDMVWTIKPGIDTFGELWDKMNDHAKPLLSARGIQINFEAQPELFTIQLGAVQRRNIYLVFKEAVNNVVKYSRCSVVNVEARIQSGAIVVTIIDNGVGFTTQSKGKGMGLLSMPHRLSEINGHFEIHSSENVGTSVKITLPIT